MHRQEKQRRSSLWLVSKSVYWERAGCGYEPEQPTQTEMGPSTLNISKVRASDGLHPIVIAWTGFASNPNVHSYQNQSLRAGITTRR